MNMDRPVRKRVRVYACRGEQEKEVARVVTNVETNIKKHIAEDNASLHALMILSCPEFEEAGVIPNAPRKPGLRLNVTD